MSVAVRSGRHLRERRLGDDQREPDQRLHRHSADRSAPLTKLKNSTFGRLKSFANSKIGGVEGYSVRDFWAPDYAMYLEPANPQGEPVLLAELTSGGEGEWNKAGLDLLKVL